MSAAISDHLPKFSMIPNMFGNIPGNKFNTYEKDWSKFDRKDFILDYFSTEWKDLLKIGELNADNSTKKFLDKIIIFLDTYAPLKRVKKSKLKFMPKPWTAVNICAKQITYKFR